LLVRENRDGTEGLRHGGDPVNGEREVGGTKVRDAREVGGVSGRACAS
jgi:hypothetical protein